VASVKAASDIAKGRKALGCLIGERLTNFVFIAYSAYCMRGGIAAGRF